MRICFINCLKIWGGGETWHLDNAIFHANQGHYVYVAAHPKGELLKRASAAGLHTAPFSISNLSMLNPVARHHVRQFLKRESFDVIVMNSARDLRIFAPLAREAGVGKIVFRRGSDIIIRPSVLNKYLFCRNVTHIIANSEATRRSLVSSGPFIEDHKITVIYNGIDVDKFTNIPATKNEIPVIGTLGRLSHQKRHDIFISVAAELKRRGLRCRIVIGGDGELRNDIATAIEKEGVEDMVSMPGNISDVPQFMAGLDVFVLTSEWEGFGYVLAEAMSAKKPVVAFETSSNGELVINGVNGYLIPWCNISAMADKIELLLSDEPLRQTMGAQGLRTARNKFSISDNCRKVETFFLQ